METSLWTLLMVFVGVCLAQMVAMQWLTLSSRRDIRRDNLEQLKAWSTEKKALLKMITDLQNRITAKDLGGYISLANQEPSGPEERQRSDEEEYKIEQLKMGLARMEQG